MMKQIEDTGTTHLWILSQEFTIADNALCISFPMSEAYELIKKYRSTIFEGGNFDLIAKVEVMDPNIAAPRRIMHTGVLVLNFNQSAQTPKKSTIAGTKKFVISAPAEEGKEEKSESQKGFDIDKAVAALNANAESKSVGYCAKYVRTALEAGGMNTDGRPNSAKDYKTYLQTKGFDVVSLTNYQPIKGDIAVFESFQGTSKNHPYGHIQMYNGIQWVSDFKQNDFWPGSDYRNNKTNFTILRW